MPVLFVELKRQRDGQVSAAQAEGLDYLNGLGDAGYPVRVVVARGFREAVDYIEGEGY